MSGILELKVPPLAVLLIVATGMRFCANSLPHVTVQIPWSHAAAAVVLCASMAIALAGVIAFRVARTTVDPTRPESSATIVTSGIYRWTRNPMYLGFAGSLLAWSLYLTNVATTVGVLVFVAYIQRFQIRPEERILTDRFGARYIAYQQQVRRWL